MYRPLMMQLLQLEREYLLNQVQYHCLAIDWEQMEKLAFMDASKGAGWSKRMEEEQAIWHQREIERKDPLAVNGEIVEARRAAGYALPTK